KRHMLLLPAYLRDQESFDAWFEASLTDVDPNPWIRSLTPEQRHGIEQKRAVAGMSYEALTAALGFPDQLTRKGVDEGARTKTVEVAVFGATSVVLEDGVVTCVSEPGREAALTDAALPVPSDPAPVTSVPNDPTPPVL